LKFLPLLSAQLTDFIYTNFSVSYQDALDHGARTKLRVRLNMILLIEKILQSELKLLSLLNKNRIHC